MPKNKNQPRPEYLKLHLGHWLLLFTVFTSAVFFVQQNVSDFRTSVLSTKQADPFDGTTLPILKSPKWTALSSAEWDLPYDQIPANKMQTLPVYDPATLKTPTEQLGWSSSRDLDIRNAKITYSVPYMGNYKLDGVEYAGSHLAVDIKVPNDTPVYAIANGVVVKTSEQNSGFGKHVVIEHQNVPTLGNSSQKETLYSSYSHLGQVLIADGTIVKKGQLIGKSGETGTATTPHVHFQIDNSNAPWHPYWPFTSLEASAAGYNFTSAINAGFGQQNGIDKSVNPVMYVQKYLSGYAGGTGSSSSGSSSSGSSNSNSSSTSSGPSYDTTSSDLPPSVFDPSSSTVAGGLSDPAPVSVLSGSADELAEGSETQEASFQDPHPAVRFEIIDDGEITVNKAETITVRALDADGNLATRYQPESYASITVLLGGADFDRELTPNMFRDGTATFEVTPTANMGLQLSVRDGDIQGESSVMKSLTLSNVVFSDVEASLPQFKAISFLKKNDVVGGYPDGTFQPDAVVSRVEALKFILKGINSKLIQARVLPFSDAEASQWYSDYVVTGYNRGIVGGYPDGTFQPASTVNKAEMLKMLLIAMESDIETNLTEDVYADVPKDAWFAPYVEYAKERNLIVPDGNFFHPEEGMTRSEVADVIYRTIIIKLSGARKYSSGINVSEGEVSQYFS